MGASNDIRAGKAFVEMSLKKSELMKGLATVAKEVKAFGDGVSAVGKKFAMLGSAITAPLLAAAYKFTESGAALKDMSARTGMSTNALSELGYAAEQSGSSMEDVEKGAMKMQKAIGAAAQGSKQQTELFAKLGLSLADLQRMSPDQQFEAIATQLSAIRDPTIRAATAMQVFGKSGTRLLPMIGDMKALREEAKRMGLSKDMNAAELADELDDAIGSLKRAAGSIATAAGFAIVPMLTGLAKRATEIAVAARQWVKENKPLIITLFHVGAAAVGLGTGLVLLGKLIVLGSTLFTAATTVVGIFGHAITIVTGLIGFFLSPIGLLVAGLVGLAAYFLYTTGAAQKAFAWFKDVFADLAEEAQESFGAISEALSAGDIGAAMKVAGALLKLEWKKVCNFFQTAWEGFLGYWNDAVSGIAMGFADVVAIVRTAWSEGLAAIEKRLYAFAATFKDQTIAIAAAMLKLQGKSDETIQWARVAMDIALSPKAVQTFNDRTDAETAATKQRIEKERQGTKDQLAQDVNRREAARQAAMNEREKEIAAARADLAKANQEARAAGAKARDEKKKQQDDLPPDLTENFMGAAGQKISGTFSGAAAGMMGGAGGVQLLARKLDRLCDFGVDHFKELRNIKGRLAVGT